VKATLSILPLMASLWITSAFADSYSIDFEHPTTESGFEKSDWMAYGPADIAYINGPDRASIDATVAHSGKQSLKITYPQASVGPSKGGHQAAIRLKPAEEYFLSYWLKFDENFSWGGSDQGGKLPGLAQGKNCSGGDVCDGTNGFTARYMWREDGAAVLYLYHMDKPGEWGEDFPLLSPDREPLFFTLGEWIHLVQRVKINSGTEANGEVQVWVNGKEALSRDGLRLVTDGSLVDTFYVSTFHGGNAPSWAPLSDSFLWIDDIEVSTEALVEADRGLSPVVLGRGTNLAHWLSQTRSRGEARRLFLQEEDIAYIAKLGFAHIRLPIDEEHMWDEDGNRDEDAFAIMHNAIRWGLKYDLKVLIDLHILRSHHFNAAIKPLWTEADAQDDFIGLWRDLSAALHQYPADKLVYELMNEPVADDHDVWNDVLGKVFAAVRELEPERTIMIGSNRWQSAHTFDELRVPDDDNIILSFHFYEPFVLSHYGTVWTFMKDYRGPVHYPGVVITQEEYDALAQSPKDEIKNFVGRNFDKQVLTAMMEKPLRVAKTLGLPLYCGEFGVFEEAPGADRLRWYEDMLEIFAEHDVSWANWNYKSSQFGFVDNDGQTIDDVKDVLIEN